MNSVLSSKNQTLEIDQLRVHNAALQNEVDSLKEELAWFRRQMFGKRSERIVKELNDNVQLLPGFKEYFENLESSQEEVKEVKAHKRKIRAKTKSPFQMICRLRE